MAGKLTSKQQAQLAVLETFPPKFDRIHRIIEEMAALHADEQIVRQLARMFDEMKAGATSIGETGLADTLGVMATLARRGGGLQLRVRGLREGFGALKTNFEGALRSATKEEPEKDQASPTTSP
jgi:hypothetical protein